MEGTGRHAAPRSEVLDSVETYLLESLAKTQARYSRPDNCNVQLLFGVCHLVPLIIGRATINKTR